MKQRYGEEIRTFILENVDDYPSDISRVTSEKFNVSRNAIAKHLRALIKEGVLIAEGRTKDREYSLAMLVDETFSLPVTPQLEEHIVWRDKVYPLLKDLPKNVLDICAFGITEMVNNVIDHSGSPMVHVSVGLDYEMVHLTVLDDGIGIWRKIQQDFNLDDPRQALLELAKGKLTSDKTKHSGEGIFFTSRMFSGFSLSSEGIYFDKYRDGEEWFIETVDEGYHSGTTVLMRIKKSATHTINEVFEAYVSDFDEYGFSKTHVPLELLQYEGESLISRSQAKRLMARVENFKEVILDFSGIQSIGQAFADEIFRVWANAHPGTKIKTENVSEEVQKMINRVKSSDCISLGILENASLSKIDEQSKKE